HQLGLGDIAEAGKHNVLTDVLDLPGQLTSGHALEGVSSILAGIGNVLGTAPGIAYGLANDLSGGAGLIGSIGQL
ncbi:hypothetical protein, partial [Enterobacter hormaechei]|uniref:hypothetical protein n=1 Tax=Enterobacter hormaechei TaxID=158836 RepID=UPI0013D720E7